MSEVFVFKIQAHWSTSILLPKFIVIIYNVVNLGIFKRAAARSRRGRILRLEFVLMPLHTYPTFLFSEDSEINTYCKHCCL